MSQKMFLQIDSCSVTQICCWFIRQVWCPYLSAHLQTRVSSFICGGNTDTHQLSATMCFWCLFTCCYLFISLILKIWICHIVQEVWLKCQYSNMIYSELKDGAQKHITCWWKIWHGFKLIWCTWKLLHTTEVKKKLKSPSRDKWLEKTIWEVKNKTQYMINNILNTKVKQLKLKQTIQTIRISGM